MKDSFELLEQVRNYKPQSRAEDLEQFLTGSIHLDFRNEIIARVEQMRDFYEDCGSKEYLETRGGIKFARLVINIFEDLLKNKLEDMEERHGQGTDN